MPYDLAVIGDIVADIVLPVEQLPLQANNHGWAGGLFVELGGACTTLVAARRMGLSAAALATIGDDEYGRQVEQMLADEGVDTRFLHLDPARKTILCVVVTDKQGQHVFLGIKDHSPTVSLREEWRQAVRAARGFFTTGYTLRDILTPEAGVEAMEIAQEAGVPVFFDPGPSLPYLAPETVAEALRRCDVLLLTRDEAALLVEGDTLAEIMSGLHERGPSVVVLKDGAEGCYVSASGELIHQPGFPVRVVDTVGAGDAFAAAFIAAHLRGGSWAECATVANAMGAAVASQQGAGRNVPGIETVRALLGAHPAARLLQPDQAATQRDSEG